MPRERTVSIHNDHDIVAARLASRQLAQELGFGMVDQARIAAAVSELTRNIVQYAGHGEALVRAIEREERIGIEIVCQDEGPGIADVGFTEQMGRPASSGMGMSGARRLMDEFEIESRVGVGTRIVVRKWLHSL